MKFKSIDWDGKPISKPGVYSGLDISLYHRADICDGPSISSSGLRLFNPDIGSPRHFYAQWQGNPEREPEDESKKRHFIIGRALHHLILGEKFFSKVFKQQPAEYPVDAKYPSTQGKNGELNKWSNNATWCKAWNADQVRLGRTVLTPKEVECIKQMAISLRNNPLIQQGLFNGAVERSFFWRDKETGIWLKWRPDTVPTHSADFADLKTTQSVLMPFIMSSIRNLAYYQQVALGREACRHVLGADMNSFTYVFVEKNPPWSNRDLRLDDSDIERGVRMNRACLRNFARCLKENDWSAPWERNAGTEKVGLSEEARKSVDTRLRYEGLADGQDNV